VTTLAPRGAPTLRASLVWSALLHLLVAAAVVFGVCAGRDFVGGAFMRSGSGVSRAGGAGAGGVGVGVGTGSGGVSRTTPTCRGPGGAAISVTRYVGGVGTEVCVPP
jgi:hypothetical protein